MNLPATSFCSPIHCICRAIADKDRVILCLSDPKNAEAERKDRDALVLEYNRLLDEQGQMVCKEGEARGALSVERGA